MLILSASRARHAIKYCLSELAAPQGRSAGLPSTWLLDPFSSAISFPDWAELDGKPCMWPIREGYDPLIVRRPQSWLLAEGWKRADGPFSAREVPSGRR